MLKKITLGVLILALLGGIILLSVVSRLLQRTADNGQRTSNMEVETLLSPEEEDYFTKAGVQKFQEKLEAPDFTLKNLEGQEISLKQLRGKVLLLNFWATWCGPCRIEKPTLEKLYHEFKDKGLRVLAVSLDQGDSLQAVRSYYEKYGYSYGSLLDPEQEVAQMYGVRGIPATYLIDREGYLVGGVIGAKLWDKGEVRKLVVHLLENTKK
jgi:peroxiredoxin